MRRLKLILSLTLIAVAPELFAKDGWIELFNGKDLSGWTPKGGKAKYFVENDCIVGETVTNTPNSFLCTETNYDNFILELDFKVDQRLNSGIQIRSECFDHETQVEWKGQTIKIPANRVHGYQVEIDPDVPRKRMWTAGIYDEARRLWLFPGQLGGETNAFSRQGIEIFKPNEWNHIRVEAVGSSITTHLNGIRCAHITDSMTPSGFIGLQVHQGNTPGIQVRFRNLRLRPLTADEAKTPSPPVQIDPAR